jgi:hypothetical protein
MCRRCGEALGESDPDPLCARCAVEEADGKITDGHSEPPPSPKRAVDERVATWRRRLAPAALVLLTIVLVVRVPAVLAALQPAPPAHEGAIETDAEGDRCVGNLWLISAALSDGRVPDPGLRCPSSGKPYVRTSEAGIAIDSCPTPSAHGAASLSVRSDAPVPLIL